MLTCDFSCHDSFDNESKCSRGSDIEDNRGQLFLHRLTIHNSVETISKQAVT